MLKRTWCLLLVITLFAAPGAAFAAAPDRDASDRRRNVLERLWDGILWLVDVDGGGEREKIREADLPRSISAGDNPGGGLDPDG